MNRREGIRVRRNRRRNKKRKQFFTLLLLVFIFFLVSSTTIKVFASLRLEEVDIKEPIPAMVFQNPVKMSLDREIEKVEKEKIEAKIQELREIEERKRKAEAEREKNRKIAYLTFDDGPSVKVTPRVLDILDNYEIKATFFVLGRMAHGNPAMLKKIHESGHAIGHHSYTHNYNHIYKNTKNFMDELNRTDKVFRQILGANFETKLLRLPGGGFGKTKQKFVQAAKDAGYVSYDWNALNGDAEGHNLSKKTLVNRLKSSVELKKDQREIIILMHDTDAKSTTADALPEIIEYLIDQGYEFRTLNQK